MLAFAIIPRGTTYPWELPPVPCGSFPSRSTYLSIAALESFEIYFKSKKLLTLMDQYWHKQCSIFGTGAIRRGRLHKQSRI